jgi:predicted nuclease with TOPRIM domain
MCRRLRFRWREKAKTMREQLQARLELLKAELTAGQIKLRELELQQLRLREVLLRLRGGIQVLEELLGQAKGQAPAPQRDSPAVDRAPNQQVDPEREGGPGTERGGPP